jgi:hypothetical protein
MAKLIDSAPDCVVKGTGATPADDVADFVVGARYEECAGFGTFMPGSTYGPEGEAAETLYMILTWAGIAFMLIALIAWVLYENRRLITYSLARAGGRSPRDAAAAAEESDLA